VAGCLAQRYSKELAEEFKGDIDEFHGIEKLDKQTIPHQVSLTPQHYAYLKISESCYNQCSFCIIPKIKGKFTSRSFDSVVKELRQIDEKGVKEINLIGQDITAYGMDIYHEMSLAKLLKKMTAQLEHIKWIRLLYAFPAHVTDELIDVIAEEDRICKYIDIPLQHISDNILKAMNRNITTQGTYELIQKFRKKIPSAHLRTTFIVGLPGETDKNFEELVQFVKDMQFEKMGTFIYSHEEGTPAYDMGNQVPDKIKKQRLDHLMKIQQDISRKKIKRFLGQTIKVLIDEKEDDGVYVGRSEFDAPGS